MMDRTKYYQKQSAAEQEAYVELCRHLEHAQDEQLLSDHTAVLLYALNSDRRAEGLELLRSQLQSRRMTPGRVNSWYVDCGARLREDREGFCQRAQEEYLRLELEAERRRRARPKDPVARIRPASAFAPERTRYLVQPYLPRGMLSILGGVSGVGKTSLALDIAAALTAGRALGFEDPEDAEGRKGCTVIYLTAENDPNKVLRPRAEAMGADLDRLFFQSGANLCMNEQDLFDICRAYRPDLLVFDPIQSYLGQGVQMNRAEQVRPLMDQLNGLAKELDMAVLLISHMSKPGPGGMLGAGPAAGLQRFPQCGPQHPDRGAGPAAAGGPGVCPCQKQPWAGGGEPELPHCPGRQRVLRRRERADRRPHHPELPARRPGHRQARHQPEHRHAGAGPCPELCGLGGLRRGGAPVRRRGILPADDAPRQGGAGAADNAGGACPQPQDDMVSQRSEAGGGPG